MECSRWWSECSEREPPDPPFKGPCTPAGVPDGGRRAPAPPPGRIRFGDVIRWLRPPLADLHTGYIPIVPSGRGAWARRMGAELGRGTWARNLGAELGRRHPHPGGLMECSRWWSERSRVLRGAAGGDASANGAFPYQPGAQPRPTRATPQEKCTTTDKGLKSRANPGANGTGHGRRGMGDGTMERAVGPLVLGRTVSWGVAPGWHGFGPLALGARMSFFDHFVGQCRKTARNGLFLWFSHVVRPLVRH